VTRRNIEERAQQLLKKAGIEEPPVPVAELVDLVGAQLSVEPLAGDISGMLYRRENTAIIGVNGADAPTRQRFTIAHEIGHLLLHKGRPVIVDKLVRVNLRGSGNFATGPEEAEANRFAAELLMPRDLVTEAAQELVGTRELVSDRWLVRQLSERFMVSGQAMEYRLVNLNLMSQLALESGWT
jgi:Zn-dependent peptidase ImmA (M78 family)